MIGNTYKKSGYSYVIRVSNHLESSWTPFFEGWSICNMGNGVFMLYNHNIDQAGLHGILNKIRDIKLILISVENINEAVKLRGANCIGI